MTWTKLEQETIKNLAKDIRSINIALIGDIKTQKSGMIDDLREVKKDISQIKKSIKLNKKQHIALFILSGVSFAFILYHLFGSGSINIFLQFMSNVIKAII